METFSSNALFNLERAGWLDAEPSADADLSVAQKAVLDAVRAEPGITTYTIAHKVQRPYSTVKHTVARLADLELIHADGTPQQWYVVVFIPRG